MFKLTNTKIIIAIITIFFLNIIIKYGLTVSGNKPSDALKYRLFKLTKTISMKRGVALKHVKTVGGCFNEKQARHIL